MKTVTLALGFCFLATIACSIASAAEDPAHEELRLLRTNVIEAIQNRDLDRQLQFVDTNVVVTWQNASVARGHEGLRKFYGALGKDAFKGYKVPPTPDELTILHNGDTGISWGYSVAEYSLFGKPYEFTNRWTATLVKKDGDWKLAAYHVSLDALDNPLMNAAKRSLVMGAGLAGLVGLILGMVIGRSISKARQT